VSDGYLVYRGCGHRLKSILLGRRILLSRRRHAVDDRYADQTENTYSDPFLGHVQQVGADRQADDEYDVADDVNPE
jgi:hypothetical protein